MKRKKILIFGDIMLDTYVSGQVNRISPEAPVPVLKVNNKKYKIGGAGNVAENLISLGCETAGIFLIGDDSDSTQLINLLEEKNINCQWIVNSPNINTIKKERVVCGNQQIVRLDYNDEFIITEKEYILLQERIREGVKWADVIVISDYAKGTCNKELCKKLIIECNRQNKIVIVDPKGNDWDKYCGATIITPNMKEINEIAGLDVKNDNTDIDNKLHSFSQKIGIKYILLTRSENGMSLIGDNEIIHITAEKREVYDVSGAGDTVVATMAAMINDDLSNIHQAMKISNIAAGIVVGKKGTAVVSERELYDALHNIEKKNSDKIIGVGDYETVRNLIEKWKKGHKKIVATSGCFDILHKGHIQLFEKAKSLGDKLIVLLNSDNSVKRLKGEKRPINTENDRALLLSSINYIDAIIIFDPDKESKEYYSDIEQWDNNIKKIASEAPMEIMRNINPSIYAKGGDYIETNVPESIYADSFVAINFVEGCSSTKIINKLYVD